MIEYLIILPALILILLAYLFYHLILKIYIAAWRFKKMDPSLKVYIAPFSGMLRVQRENIEKYGDSQHFMKQIIKENPEQKAYLTNIGIKPFLIFCDAQLVKEVCLNPKKFRKFNLYKHSKQSYDRGIFLAEDQNWSNIRRIIRHCFNHQQLKAMIPTIQKSIKNNFTFLKSKIQNSSQKSVDFKVVHDTEILIGEILVKIFFSEEGAKKKIGSTSLSIALAEFTVSMFDRSRSGTNILFNLFFGEKVKDLNFSSKDRQLYDLLIEIRHKIEEILDKRMTLEDDPQQDFIQHYLAQKKRTDQLIAEAEAKGQQHKYIRITKEDIIHQLISFYFAGIDTTGHLVAFTMYALAEYPQHEQRIIDEIKANIKDLSSITYENLGKLQFTSNFLDECLRMWPPATGILARATREETLIGPYLIPGGTLVGTNIIGLMHNPKYYENPSVFNPDRWAIKGAHSSEAYSFIPFSAGPRSCIGKYLALMQTKLIIIYLLNLFDVSRTEVPLRMQAKFLYEPIEEDLIRLKMGGMRLDDQ